MKVYLAADHAGFILKDEIKSKLPRDGFEVEDLSAPEIQPEDDYPAYAFEVARKVASDPGSKGILVCGSGQGMAMAANRVKGVRASVVWDEATAKETREDNDSNVLSIPARFITKDQAEKIIHTWLETEFSGAERHRRRVQQIDEEV